MLQYASFKSNLVVGVWHFGSADKNKFVINEGSKGKGFRMKKQALLAIIFTLLAVVLTSGMVFAQDIVEVESEEEKRDISEDFIDIVTYLYEDEGILSTDEGTYFFADDYVGEWAQMYWYQWESLAETQVSDFVIRTKVSWNSASDTPQWSDSGCGFVFREQDSDNHMKANLALDGFTYINGYKAGQWLSYGKKQYSSHSTSGSVYFTLAAEGGNIAIMIDDAIVHEASNVLLTDPGYLAYVVVSGTNKDYGTRCTFEEVELFVID